MERSHVFVAAGVLAIAGLAGLWLGRPPSEAPPVVVERTEPDGEQTTARLTVHVSGEVVSPGLVSLDPGDRVADAIAAAGGARRDADLSAVNLAGAVQDGDQVVVPRQGGTRPPGGGSDGRTGVNVNRATVAELEALPGVGPVLAQRIHDFRAEHGDFETVEDLLAVPGIGEGKLATLREAVRLR